MSAEFLFRTTQSWTQYSVFGFLPHKIAQFLKLWKYDQRHNLW